MKASFREVFRKDPYENRHISKEAIDSLMKRVPDCFSYILHEGKVSIGLKGGVCTFIMDVNLRNETEEDRRLAERLSALPTNNTLSTYTAPRKISQLRKCASAAMIQKPRWRS